MTPTEILKHEHQMILHVLDAAEKEAASIRRDGIVHVPLVREMVDFFRNFADRCHHAKEEKHLFAFMHQRGMSTQFGPLAVMLHEHDQGRARIQAILNAPPEGQEPDEAAAADIAENLSRYASLLRSHIDKEDHVLYPMADQLLSSADQEALADAFDRVETEEIGEGVHEKYHQWVHELVGA